MLANRYPTSRHTARYNGGAVARPLLWMRVRTVARAIYSTRDAATMLNVSQATLRGWAHRAGIHTQDDPTDERVRGWTYGELKHLADLRGRTLGKPPVEPEPSRRMRELEHEVEELKTEVHALSNAVARLEAVHAPQLAQSGQPLLPRQIRPTARHTPQLPKLPPGATTFRRLITEYHADERTVREWILGGELPAPTTEGGPWFAGATVERIYTAEQIPAVRAALERLTGRAET